MSYGKIGNCKIVTINLITIYVLNICGKKGLMLPKSLKNMVRKRESKGFWHSLVNLICRSKKSSHSTRHFQCKISESIHVRPFLAAIFFKEEKWKVFCLFLPDFQTWPFFQISSPSNFPK